MLFLGVKFPFTTGLFRLWTSAKRRQLACGKMVLPTSPRIYLRQRGHSRQVRIGSPQVPPRIPHLEKRGRGGLVHHSPASPRPAELAVSGAATFDAYQGRPAGRAWFLSGLAMYANLSAPAGVGARYATSHRKASRQNLTICVTPSARPRGALFPAALAWRHGLNCAGMARS